MTLKEAVVRRDGLMAFVAKAEKLKTELNNQKQESERENNKAKESIAREWDDLARAKENFACEVDAWDELQKEAQIPNWELERITKECDALRQELERNQKPQASEVAKTQTKIEALQKQLTEEKKQHRLIKEIADASSNEISELTQAKTELSQELDSLKAIHAYDTALLESARTENASLKKERKNLMQEKKDLLDAQSSNEKTITTLKESIQDQNVKISGLETRISNIQPPSFFLSDLELLDALSREAVEYFHPPRNIVTLGSGPIDEDDFDHYLRDQGMQPMTTGSWIVVGREGWTEQALNDLLDDNDLDEVRVFSQELFMTGILTTHDPFSLPIDILMKFAEGHPALEFLISQGFEWPEIILEEDYGIPVYLRGSGELVEESPLFRMGYQVGITKGQEPTIRQALLRDAYHGDIPHVEDDDYMEEWGNPRRSKRLWRIAHHISWLIRSRQNIPSMRYAVKDWHDDLGWLKEQFYTNRMRFQWPHSEFNCDNYINDRARNKGRKKPQNKTREQVDDRVSRLLYVLRHGALTEIECMRQLKAFNAPIFFNGYISPALSAGLIECTLSKSTNRNLQKYRLTQKGHTLL
jgi:chemotaxis protein histidine kinase CheA